MFTSKIQYDLIEASAKRGSILRTYLPTVDRDGFDIIFDDGQSLMSVQLKTNFSYSASNWYIHRKLYRPIIDNLIAYNLYSTSRHSGMGGGVIVININTNESEETSVKYMYSDFLILHMLKEGFFHGDKFPNKIQSIYHSLTSEIDGKFNIKKYGFVEAPTTDHLLNLMGLHSIYNHMWRHEYLDYIRDKNDPEHHSSWEGNIPEYVASIKNSLIEIGY